MNAAGTLGFAPSPRGPVDLSRLGAFVTNPLSLAPRTPAETRRLLPFAGGFLLHTGLPNPGLSSVLRQYAHRWAGASLPVIVHILANHPDEVYRVVRRLEGIEGILAVELGLPPQVDPAGAALLLQAAAGELLILPCLPPERIAELAPTLKKAGVQGPISLQPPRGALPGSEGRLVGGRLYGPAVLPLALAAVHEARRAGFEVIGSGGVYSDADISAMRAAGAAAVQLDAVLWRGSLP